MSYLAELLFPGVSYHGNGAQPPVSAMTLAFTEFKRRRHCRKQSVRRRPSRTCSVNFAERGIQFRARASSKESRVEPFYRKVECLNGRTTARCHSSS